MNNEQLERLLQTAILEAGQHIKMHAFAVEQLDWKKKDDPVTNLDREAEQLIRKQFGKQVNYVGEEYGVQDNQQPETLHIDSIDGTKSFVRKDFNSAVSIGVERNGQLIAGAVYDFMRDILYMGIDEKTPKLIHAGKTYPLLQPHPMEKLYIAIDDKVKLEHPEVKPYYTFGSIALTLAQTAAGMYDGIVNLPRHANTWDVAGGIYLMQAQAMNITTYNGDPLHFKDTDSGLIATHPKADVIRRYIQT